MATNCKLRTVKLDQLILSPELSVNYRRTLIGLQYRSRNLSDVPHQLLLEYVMAHPPIGYFGGDYFYVLSNIRTVDLKPFLPPNTRVRVIVDESVNASDIEMTSVQREMVNLIVLGMDGKMFANALAILWAISDKNNSNHRKSFPSSKLHLAKLAGLRRQSLSEVLTQKSCSQQVSDGRLPNG